MTQYSFTRSQLSALSGGRENVPPSAKTKAFDSNKKSANNSFINSVEKPSVNKKNVAPDTKSSVDKVPAKCGLASAKPIQPAKATSNEPPKTNKTPADVKRLVNPENPKMKTNAAAGFSGLARSLPSEPKTTPSTEAKKSIEPLASTPFQVRGLPIVGSLVVEKAQAPYCYRCERHHLASACPTITCRVCFQTGHIGRNCPWQKLATGKPAKPLRLSPERHMLTPMGYGPMPYCYRCEAHHTVRLCPYVTCRKCDKLGHIAADCELLKQLERPSRNSSLISDSKTVAPNIPFLVDTLLPFHIVRNLSDLTDVRVLAVPERHQHIYGFSFECNVIGNCVLPCGIMLKNVRYLRDSEFNQVSMQALSQDGYCARIDRVGFTFTRGTQSIFVHRDPRHDRCVMMA